MESPAPPDAWKQPEFRDDDWFLHRGRQFISMDERLRTAQDMNDPVARCTDPFQTEIGLVCQRGFFRVLDKGKVKSLSLSLTAREHRRLKVDVPASPTAYEFFLRGNQLILTQGVTNAEHLHVAREFYERCLQADPRYAPGWARLGRCQWLIGKGGDDPDENVRNAEASFARALELNPELPLALNLHALLPYIVAEPNLCLSDNKWGRLNPPYVFFKYDGKAWQRIQIGDFPAEFTTMNVAIRLDTRHVKEMVQLGTVPAEEIRQRISRLPQLEFKTILREPVANERCPQYPKGPKAPIPMTPGTLQN